MAPYAYLKGYYLDEDRCDVQFNRFVGYISFVSDFYDNYKDLISVQIIYANEDIKGNSTKFLFRLLPYMF